MRIEKLDGGKIKVTLTGADLDNLDIDIKRLASDSSELQSFLFSIMETIKEETGFNPYTGQVVVEAMPSSDGISLVVSKMKTKQVEKITKDQFNNATSIKAKQKNPTRTEIFYFDSFDDLCMALKETAPSSLLVSSLYRLENTYCFTIKSKKEHTVCINTMTEFSAKRSAYSLQMQYIREHGELIARGKELLVMTENLRDLV